MSIAIVGMACRVPGAPDLPGLWRLLREGRDAIGDPPPGRAGVAQRSGFIEAVDEFDADFFGIPPREAAAMDPQQRLALELAWEGLEDAGVPSVEGARGGVFLGVMGGDFGDLMAAAGAVDRHSLCGVGRTIVANRVSRRLGWAGPSLVVDTGQSSSLVAVHLACESLRTGEADIALAGGLNLILSPLSGDRVEQFGALSPDGRCYAFDARANGFVRGEGGGIVVLKGLARAISDGDRVYGVIRGSAVGAGSGDEGLTVPSRDAQASVIRAALERADLAPADVQYVELHGPGTPVGDPIEAAALGAAYGADRAEPLAVGSIKTNIGHLEGAAGIAGLIKTALCLRSRELVPSLNFATPNPRIPLDELRLRVVTAREPWPSGGGPAAAGVSSFGVGGTNAHVVVGKGPAPASGPGTASQSAATSRPAAAPWLLSAASEAGLRGQAARLRSHADGRPVDVAFSLATTRAHLEWRAAVTGADGLEALERGERADSVVTGRARHGRAVFVFPGQGSQWEGMAVELLEAGGAFAESMAACEEALSSLVDWSLAAVLRGEAGAPSLEQVDVVQPALFAVMVSLAAHWRAHGVEPDAVVGHSQGEIAAAHVAGGLSLEDAAGVVAMRSRAVADELAGRGGMVSVALREEGLAARLDALGGRVSLAATNGPGQAVVSGEPEALDELVAGCERDGVWVRRIPVDYASHSGHVEAIRERVLRDLAPIRPRSGTVPFFSTVTAELVDTAGLGAEYWYRGLRDRVRFEEATRALIQDGATTFVEVSAHPVLTVAVQATGAVAALGTLRRGEGGPERFTAALAEAHVNGVDVDWPRFFAGRGARRVDLPTYAWQRRRHWPDLPAGVGDVAAAGLAAADHPLLGAAVELAGADQWLFTGRLSPAEHPWLRDDAVLESVVVPDAAFVELALRAGGEVGCDVVEKLTLEAPLVVSEDGAVQLQVLVGALDDHGRREVAFHSRPAGDEAAWTRHASGRLAPAGEPWSVEGSVDGAEVPLDGARAEEAERFGIHPALLDAALLHIEGSDVVPVSFAGVRLHRRGARTLRVSVKPAGAETLRLAAVDETGAPVVSADVVTVGPVRPASGAVELLALRWTEVALPVPSGRQPRVVDASDSREAVLAQVKASGDERLAVVTRGAVAVADGEVPDPAQAAVWGVVHRARSEHPGRFVVVDVDDAGSVARALAIGEPQVAVREGRAFVPRLVRAPCDGGERVSAAIHAADTLDAALAAPEPVVVSMRLDPVALRRQARTGTLPAVLRDLMRTPTHRAREEGSWARRLADAPEREREELLLALVRAEAAAVLGHESVEAIDARRAFKELGFDSQGAVELRNRLAHATATRLPSTLMFDYPKPVAVAGYLARALSPHSNGETTEVDEEVARIDELDAESLIRMTFEKPAPLREPGLRLS